ncbi:hydroxysqualene dehydroxylase HpnE [Algihabitans albus]|uniref:hydroxysqualene dehydroxylase HpnE n=1 Tax=Algihabitans albus TaxID=2164067 RepID=UPI000E5D0875|nr:hydroxysqualene dehydroxylase HpnE [Algihabitans albus]
MTRKAARVHVVGAGMAGLAAAVRLSGSGVPVTLYEAAPRAGGRCRSYHDPVIGRTIDNGNHLLLSANRAALSYLEEIGARDGLIAPTEGPLPFLDLTSGETWRLEPSEGPIAWWVFQPSKRIPGTRAFDFLKAVNLRLAGPDTTVAEAVGRAEPADTRFWRPLTVAVLNATPERASARLLWTVLAETFLKGAAHCKPLIARDSLDASLVEPAVRVLEARGCTLHHGQRLRGLVRDGQRIAGLDFGADRMELAADERVILATPPAVTAELLPELRLPEGNDPIVNAHVAVPETARLPEGAGILGLVGGVAEWIFLRPGLASVTVSAADRWVDRPAEDLAARLWPDVAKALSLPLEPAPPIRIVKEKRATFSQTPDNLRLRPKPTVGLSNLLLAGDYTDTGLPATIEGAVTSGQTAAGLILQRLPDRAAC